MPGFPGTSSRIEPSSVLTPSVRARLEKLEPSHPELYFELGEEIAEVAKDPKASELARHLFVLAFHLDRARGGQQLAAQSCLALANYNPTEKDRRWLVSLATLLDRRNAPPDWLRKAEASVASQTGYTAATVLGLVRAGEGNAARARLAEPGVAPLLVSFERLLSANGESGAMRWVEHEMSRWPCSECHNQRIVKKGGKDAVPKLCITCGGNPGPKLNNESLVLQLRLESQLLHGIQRSWSAQVWSDQGAPVRDADPEELPKLYDVDTDRPFWRNGRWVALPTSATPLPTAVAPTAPPRPTLAKPVVAPAVTDPAVSDQ